MRKPLLILVLALALPSAASAGSLSFTTPQQLPHGDPKAHPRYGGGEPSIAFDPTGDRHVYVTAPQGIPSVAGPILGAGDSSTGIAYWASADGGRSWPVSGTTGTLTGGGDSDVEVLRDHTVLAADLEAVDAAICTSKDFAHSFTDCNGGLTANHTGPDNDREWLTRGTKPGEVYLTYHDFAGGLPIIEHSTDSGKTWAPCGSIIDPLGPAAKTYTPVGGTLVAKPTIAPDGTIFVEFATPDLLANPVGAPLNHIYMAVAKGGCTPTTVFHDYVVYQDPGADLAKIFQATARDAGGVLYVLAAGHTKAGEAGSNVFLFTSTDEGKTWSAPTRVNEPALTANVFPTLAGGQGRGEAVLGWFGSSTSGDPNNTKNQWRYYAAATYDGGRTFNETAVTPDVIHYGDICTQGIFCGLIPGQPGDRNLADFASLALDPASGCAAAAIPGDPYNRPDLPNGANDASSSAYVALQQGASTCFTAANAGKAAGAVGASAAGTCIDRRAPAVRLKTHRI
ncbi:MAG: exo-alpha-sialidase, partial [Solirubrobacterales bacterium]|nr:exo-alpha-sialidase [Solirubrobacterales bacterium]